MKKFLFAGCGSIGRRHIQNLKTLLSDPKILAYRVRKESLGDFEKKYAIETFDDLENALNEKPSAVFVTNPTSLHLKVARAAAERGIPLFIEKPLSHSLEGVDDFMNLCEKKKTLVLLGYKMRFHPSLQKMKEIITEGRFGKVLSARAHYSGYLPDWHPWEDYRRMYSSRSDLGGGVILDCIHELDYLYWLLGDIAGLKAVGGKVSNLEIDTEDSADILLKFKSGAVGSVHMSYAERPEYRSSYVALEKGMMVWDSQRKSLDIYDAEKKSWQNHPEPSGWEPNEMFMGEMRHFLNCLEGREKPMHDLKDVRRVLEIALTAKKMIEITPTFPPPEIRGRDREGDGGNT